MNKTQTTQKTKVKKQKKINPFLDHALWNARYKA